MSGFLVTEGALRQALCAGYITPAIQPIVSAPEGRTTGIEMLARWFLADGCAVPPDAFIAQASRSGLEAAIARTLMEKTAPVACRLAQSLGQPLVVGVNAGPTCLTDPAFAVACAAFISDCHNANVGLAVEITIREPLTSPMVLALGRLRAMGIKIVLNDLGMGYATADVKPWLLPDIVKLKRSLTMLAGTGDSGGQLTNTLETLNYHGMTILAEGVETRKEYDWLYAHGIRLFQGDLFGRPVSPENLSKSILTRVFIPHIVR
ncbi:EAL domain-containing protein [Enterobacter cloacae]|nr:EAL domain-containing protein [Enterobacter cloacae]